jgi:phosphinothricin acetyltransferase
VSATIRLATQGDVPRIHQIYTPIVANTVISFEYEPPSLEELGQRVEDYLRQYPWLVLEWAGVVAGYAYASAHRSRRAYQWSVDVSAYVDADYRQRGIGKALYRSLLAILRAQGYYNAYAGIALPNPASVRLHESVGFRALGVYEKVGYKLGAWHDVGWWQCRIQDHAADPTPPLSINEIAESATWDSLRLTGL